VCDTWLQVAGPLNRIPDAMPEVKDIADVLMHSFAARSRGSEWQNPAALCMLPQQPGGDIRALQAEGGCEQGRQEAPHSAARGCV
jgi:hypothetical protein